MVREEWSDISKAGDGQRLREMSHGRTEGAEMNKDSQREGRWLEMIREWEGWSGWVEDKQEDFRHGHREMVMDGQREKRWSGWGD